MAIKRFYKAATVAPDGDGHAILLDGKPIRTPGKVKLVVPSAALAGGIAQEWEAQEKEVKPATMPMMQLASTAIDVVAKRRDAVVDEIAKFAETDLVCYRADQQPKLEARQHEAWQPLIDWVTLQYDAPLVVTSGIIPVEQPPPSLRALRLAVASHDPLRLTALHAVTAAAGSLVIGLAVLARRIDAEAAYALSQIDEAFQVEQWGEDHEATIRRAALRADLLAAGRFLDLLDQA